MLNEVSVSDRNDIVSILNNYISLEKTGAVYRGFCPFCNSLKDLLVVKSETGEWHCFQCGAGGTAADFVSLYEGTVMPRPPAKESEHHELVHNVTPDVESPGEEDELKPLAGAHEAFEHYYDRLRKVTGYSACAIMDSNRQLIDKDNKANSQCEFEKLDELFISMIDAVHILFNESFSTMKSEVLFSSDDGIALYLSTYFREEPVHVIVLGSDKSQQYLMRMHALTLPKY